MTPPDHHMPAGQVAPAGAGGSRRLQFQNASGTISHLFGSGFSELRVDGFDSRTICVQLQRTQATIWTNGRLSLQDGWLPPGAWQAHAPGEAFRGIGRQGYDLMRFSISEPAVNTVLAGLNMGARSSAVEIKDSLTVGSQFLLALSREIESVMATGDTPSRLYADSLFQTVIAHLLTRHSNLAGGVTPRRFQGGLSPWQVRRVTDHMMANLDGEIGLAELAALVGLSEHHFCTAFRRSTGLPPHRWLTAQRMERAKALLREGDHGLTEIALAVGYGSQSAFGAAFRRIVGVTPTGWRRAQGVR